jgi:hypothetical protein
MIRVYSGYAPADALHMKSFDIWMISVPELPSTPSVRDCIVSWTGLVSISVTWLPRIRGHGFGMKQATRPVTGIVPTSDVGHFLSVVRGFWCRVASMARLARIWCVYAIQSLLNELVLKWRQKRTEAGMGETDLRARCEVVFNCSLRRNLTDFASHVVSQRRCSA